MPYVGKVSKLYLVLYGTSTVQGTVQYKEKQTPLRYSSTGTASVVTNLSIVVDLARFYFFLIRFSFLPRFIDFFGGD